ncbi:MAG TPA: carboxypeptidase regulatory-like domain-containing protein, partial [bacterium]
VPAGQHDVRVFAPGFEPAMVPVNVANGGEAAIKPIQLRIARGKVIGRLVDEQGKSASGIAVHLAPFGSATTTDQDGIFQFLGVGPGDIVLGVNDPYFTPQPQRFTLARDEARNLGNVRVGRAQVGGSGNTAELPPSSDRAR